MASAIGWYGPLIDLSEAASHVGDFVQLLVFVHRTTPVQYKLSSKGGEVIRTDVQVGDDTRPFFSVSLWQKQMGEMAASGNVILLQNVKITKFGFFIEARTVQCSSLLCLVRSYESLISRGLEDLMKECRVGKMAVEKLRKVITWVKRDGFALYKIAPHGPQEKRRLLKNWKVPEHIESQHFYLLSEVSCLRNSCKAMFSASVGEIFLPITWRELGELEKEKMFVSRRITGSGDDGSVAEDFICTGCQLCGLPLDTENGCMLKQKSVPFYCTESSNHVHVVGPIYRPFMLYVWDESEYLPLLVRNKAAELLFGNITADKVSSCYKRQKQHNKLDGKDFSKENISKATEEGLSVYCSSGANESLEASTRHYSDKNIHFHIIWLILLKMLLQHGKNTSLKFEVTVNARLDGENGKFEMVSVTLPCIRTK